MPTKSLGTLLHLSDLHLGPTPKAQGKRFSSRLTSFLSDVYPVYSHGGIHCQGHDIGMLKAMPRDIAKACQWLEIKWPSICIVSGDILTNPEPSRVFNQFAHAYLTSGIRIDGQVFGLKFAHKNIFSVPGNHDVLFAKNRQNYVSSRFCRKRTAESVQCAMLNGHAIAICTLDSNDYETVNIARGKLYGRKLENIKENLKSTIRNFHKDLRIKKQPRPLIRILVLHHPPRKTDQWHQLEGHELIKSLENHIDLVFCGHLHEHNVYPFGKMTVIEGGSASQVHREQNKNHFFLLSIYEKQKEYFIHPILMSYSREDRFVPDAGRYKPRPLRAKQAP